MPIHVFFPVFLIFCFPSFHVLSHPTAGFCAVQDTHSVDLGTGYYQKAIVRIRSEQVLAPTFSEDEPASSHLFGKTRKIEADREDLHPYQHPRIIVGQKGWDEILAQYADRRYFRKRGTWTHYFQKFTLNKGPGSRIIATLAELYTSGYTAKYEGRPYRRNSTAYESYRRRLKPLANKVQLMSPLKSTSFFICAFWAGVSEVAETDFLPKDIYEKYIQATVAWARVLLAHRSYYCNPRCPYKKKDQERTFIWNMKKRWEVKDDYYTAGSSMALAYDVLYEGMCDSDRKTIRSAIALPVLKRHSWGSSVLSTRESPNAISDPHRIVSNSALHHSNLYLTNLAIEGEEGFDRYVSKVLQKHASRGFNNALNERFMALIKAYMTHVVYPDGSTHEDGYTYFVGLREGSLALVAAERRGIGVLSSPRFRNFIHNAAQMYEPWHCGNLIGHTRGGGNDYNTFVGLFRYAYPSGELPAMLWRQRFGAFQNYKPCRIEWWQTMVQLAFLGGEHSTIAESPQGLSVRAKDSFMLSYYATRRDLLIARDSLDEAATYFHFDARPDAFFLEHDNASRGVITFTSLRQTWLQDLPWKHNTNSREHSLMHVDGLAQAQKAPSVRMIRVTDNHRTVLAAADLTYAYNVQWSTEWSHNLPPHGHVTVYDEEGLPSRASVEFETKESSDPWTLGWPADDKGEDIGFSASTVLYGIANIGFKGLWTWKRKYREQDLYHMVRSVGLIRPQSTASGAFFLVDSVNAGPGAHTFESYLILGADVKVQWSYSHCWQNSCSIILSGKGDAVMEIHVLALSERLSYREEVVSNSARRLIVKSSGLSSEEVWILICPRTQNNSSCSVSRGENDIEVIFEGKKHHLSVDDGDHGVISLETPPMLPKEISSWRAYGIDEQSLVGNKEAFLHKTDMPLQKVFNFTSLSSSVDYDDIRTCGWYTTMETHIAIYECGEKEGAFSTYMARNCRLLPETIARSFCSLGSHQSRWGGRLKGGQVYYLAVSGKPIAGRKPRFSITHNRRRGPVRR